MSGAENYYNTNGINTELCELTVNIRLGHQNHFWVTKTNTSSAAPAGATVLLYGATGKRAYPYTFCILSVPYVPPQCSLALYSICTGIVLVLYRYSASTVRVP